MVRKYTRTLLQLHAFHLHHLTLARWAVHHYCQWDTR